VEEDGTSTTIKHADKAWRHERSLLCNYSDNKVHDLNKVRVKKMRAIWDFEANEEWALSLKKGDIVDVIEQDEIDGSGASWWEGSITSNNTIRAGLFPSNYCEIVEIFQVFCVVPNESY
jgi:hypothetical protein